MNPSGINMIKNKTKQYRLRYIIILLLKAYGFFLPKDCVKEETLKSSHGGEEGGKDRLYTKEER